MACNWLTNLICTANPSLESKLILDFNSPKDSRARAILSTICVWVMEDTLKDLSHHAYAEVLPEFKTRSFDDVPVHPQLFASFTALTSAYVVFDYETAKEHAANLQHVISMEFIRFISMVTPYLDDITQCRIIEVIPNFTMPYVVLVKVHHDVSALRIQPPTNHIPNFLPVPTGL